MDRTEPKPHHARNHMRTFFHQANSEMLRAASRALDEFVAAGWTPADYARAKSKLLERVYADMWDAKVGELARGLPEKASDYLSPLGQGVWVTVHLGPGKPSPLPEGVRDGFADRAAPAQDPSGG